MDTSELQKHVDALLQEAGQPPSEEREWFLENVRERAEECEYTDGDPDLQEVNRQEIMKAIMEHRRYYPIEPQAALRSDEPAALKAYWQLLADLDEEEVRIKFPSKKIVPWRPFAAEWTNWIFGDSASRQARVTLEFDHRFSQQALVTRIRDVWPRLLEGGYVRRTRTLQPKAMDLIRLICIELPPGATWAKRLSAWNRRCGTKHGRYKEIALFQRDFRRAEEQLTGEHYGLEYLCNPIARLTEEELAERCERGDRQALAYRERLRKRTTERVDAKRRVEAYALKARQKMTGRSKGG